MKLFVLVIFCLILRFVFNQREELNYDIFFLFRLSTVLVCRQVRRHSHRIMASNYNRDQDNTITTIKVAGKITCDVIAAKSLQN